jgi:hypothetical protein
MAVQNVLGLKNGGAGISVHHVQSEQNLPRHHRLAVECRLQGTARSDCAEFAGPGLSAVGTAAGGAVAGKFGVKVNDLFKGIDPATAAAIAFGIKANPRTEVLFNTQQYRTHSMEFILIPRSLDEAKAIDRLLYFFQFYSLPRYSGSNGNNPVSAFMVGFPYEFTIDMLSAQGTDNFTLDHVNKIGRSVLTRGHRPCGGREDGVREGRRRLLSGRDALRLSFQEVRMLARGDDEIRRKDSAPGPEHWSGDTYCARWTVRLGRPR